MIMLEGSDISNEVDNIKILKDVSLRVGICTRAAQDYGAYALVPFGSTDNEVQHLFFGTHTRYLSTADGATSCDLVPPVRKSHSAAACGSLSYTHLRAHETPEHLVCRLLLEKKKTRK